MYFLLKMGIFHCYVSLPKRVWAARLKIDSFQKNSDTFHEILVVILAYEIIPIQLGSSSSPIYSKTDLLPLTRPYCWWFRNPVNLPVEVGSLSQHFTGQKWKISQAYLSAPLGDSYVKLPKQNMESFCVFPLSQKSLDSQKYDLKNPPKMASARGSPTEQKSIESCPIHRRRSYVTCACYKIGVGWKKDPGKLTWNPKIQVWLKIFESFSIKLVIYQVNQPFIEVCWLYQLTGLRWQSRDLAAPLGPDQSRPRSRVLGGILDMVDISKIKKSLKKLSHVIFKSCKDVFYT